MKKIFLLLLSLFLLAGCKDVKLTNGEKLKKRKTIRAI